MTDKVPQNKDKTIPELKTFSKATVSAMAATGADWLVTASLTGFFGLWYIYATVAGAVCGGILNCVVNYSWVFRKSGASKIYIALKYLAVWLVSIGLNTGFTWILTTICTGEKYYMISRIAASGLTALLWNYPMQRFFVYTKNNFKRKKNGL